MKYIYYLIKIIVCSYIYIAIFFLFPEISSAISYAVSSTGQLMYQGISEFKTEIAELKRELAPGKAVASLGAAAKQPDMKTVFSETSSDIILPSTSVNIHYYNQSDPRWGSQMYGPNNPISKYGCGPTALAMVVTSLTENEIDPAQMAKWAYDNGYFCQDSGSYHSIIPEGAAQWGLSVEPVTDYSSENLQMLLATGNILVALMGNGHFTENGHFILIRGIALSGNFLVADPMSLENSQIEWPSSTIIGEAKYAANNDGPVWAIKCLPE